MHCQGCDQEVHPFQELAFPSGKLVDKCPTEGCGCSFGTHEEAPAAIKLHVATADVPAAIVALPHRAPVVTTQSAPGGAAGLIQSLELRLGELESEANIIRRMLRAASEGVN